MRLNYLLVLVGGKVVIAAKRELWWGSCIALVLTGVIGCGGPYDATVVGMVTLDGNPIQTGSISFVPSSGGPQGYALVDQSGNYEVFTGREAGLPAGQYNVSVVARESSTTRSEDGGPPPPGKAITPQWYASPTTSGLEFTVESGSNEIDLQLTTQPPAGWKTGGR